MSKYPALILTLLVVLCSSAAAQPAVIPRIGEAPHDVNRTYELVREYLDNPSNGLFTIVRADRATGTIIARLNGMNAQQWGEWAYCKLGPKQMLDTLNEGAVTLTITITQAGSRSSEIKIAADFRGTYTGLGNSETTAQCISTGALENRILEAAGAPPENA
jgi:hypothetical protein